MGKVVYSTHVSLEDGIDAYAMNWSPDSKQLGIGTQRAQSWDATSGKNVVNYGPMRSGSVMDIVFSPDGKRVAVTSVGSGVQIYNTATGQLLMTYSGNSQARLQTTGGGPLVRLNLPASGGSGSGVTAWSPDGSLMASSFFAPGANNIQIWNTTTGKMLLQYNGHADFVESIAWSPDGSTIASAGDHIELWNTATGKTEYTFNKNPSTLRLLVWSPDGRYIASADSPEATPTTIQVWIA